MIQQLSLKIVRIILLQQTEPQDVYGADRFELLIVLAESAFAELCPVVKRAPQHVGFVGHLDFNVYGFSGVKNAGHVKAGEFGVPGFSARFAVNEREIFYRAPVRLGKQRAQEVYGDGLALLAAEDEFKQHIVERRDAGGFEAARHFLLLLLADFGHVSSILVLNFENAYFETLERECQD